MNVTSGAAGQVAWLKKAPKEVRENVKEECVLVHWFDEWEEVSSKPTRSDPAPRIMPRFWTFRGIHAGTAGTACGHLPA